MGIGGGFSAGKSRFLNSLLGMNVLPEGLGPTTAVPTVLAAGPASIRALNPLQRMVPIDVAALQALAHGFDKQFGTAQDERLGLAHLIRLLVIHDPAMRWQHLALLDTPGYDKPDGDSQALTDEAIAREQLGQADHVVWLVSARNGAMRQDDIRFLQSLPRQRPVFFVVTQADQQSPSALPAILAGIRRDAAAAGIPCAGVMGWSAPPAQQQGRIEGGDDIGEWFDGLDLQPRLTDKRRSAARLMAELDDYLAQRIDEGRDELAVLNSFWQVAEALPEDSAAGLRQLLSSRRERQRGRGAHRARLQEFARDLDATLADALDAIDLADARPEQAIEADYQEAMLALRAHNSAQRQEDIFGRLLQAACHGHAAAQLAIAECYRLGTGTKCDHGLAFRWCAKAAGQGMAEARFMLGNACVEGTGTATDRAAALDWYRAAAGQGHVRAQMTLYACLMDEPGADTVEAIAWLKRAAEQGHAEAEHELGNCYLHGRGVSRNRGTAGSWYNKAAQRGHAASECEIGRAFQTGSAGEDDDANAAQYFRRAAEQDHAEAQYLLARCYLDGRGVVRNRGHAASWLRKAWELGHVPALTALGHCHCAAEEYEEGVRCYREAADARDAEALYKLGECYLAGLGVRKNRGRAQHYFLLAEEQGYTIPAEVMDEA